jgi:ABC-type transport system involved in multi-copper enzyme maturation permease subunit
MTSDADDSWLERFGDWINPILVKETRQALKSRQFSVTFGLLLAASLLVSFGGVALSGPGLDYRSAGIGFFLAYFVVLAFAVFVVVPFGAYRSLSTEQEERTFELLSISALTPRQIIAGKLLSAIIQMFIYYSATAPYMGFTLLLKGIDVPSIMIVLVASMLVSVGFCMIGLLLAALARRRGWQIFLSVAIITGLLFAMVLSFFLVGSALVFMGPLLREKYFWVGLATMLTAYVTYFALAFQLSASQLTFEADNRSSKVRVALAVQFLAALGWVAYWWVAEGAGDFRNLIGMKILLFMHWFLVGGFLTSELPGLSKRVARQIPRGQYRRAIAALFLPGPGTGMGFLLSNLVCLVAMVALAEWTTDLIAPRATPRPIGTSGRWPTAFALVGASYVFLYCGLGGMAVRAIRRWRPMPVIAGAAITWLIAAVGSLVPSFFALVLPDHQLRDYRIWQITDPIATLLQIFDGAKFELALVLIPCGLAALVGLLNLRLMADAAHEIHMAGVTAVSLRSPSSDDAGRAPAPA